MIALPRFVLLIVVLQFITSPVFSQSDPRYRKLSNGLEVYPARPDQLSAKALRILVIDDDIFRVTGSAGMNLIDGKSLITVTGGASTPAFEIIPGKDEVALQTSKLTALIDLLSGRIMYVDKEGKEIVAEKQAGRTLVPSVAEGKRTFAITQAFSTSPDDAWYGLGQHQDGLMNYKGNQVFLFQNNTEVAVPFLISRKNYGILWDNYSITRVGDTRPYNELSSLALFSKDGEAGWLTATYRNKASNDSILMVRAESEIKYEYLNDSKRLLPPTFRPETGSITWEGSFASGIGGTHKLRFTYAGYISVWIDGLPMLERWRQAWNPGSAILDIPLTPGVKKSIKIQWRPDGGESYVTCKWLDPVSDINSFAFASEAGQQLDYYFIHGRNMDEVIGGYRKVTGKATMLPLWAFGFWQSRERYKTQDEILQTVQEFRKRRIPLDNIVLDWSYWKQDDWGSQEFDQTRFSNPDSLINALHRKYNTRFMISVWPKFYEGIAAFKDFDKNGWLYRRNVADRQRDWIAQGYVSTFYDAFNENAQKGFWNLLNKKLYSKGVDAWWMDASEPDILSNVSPQKRKEQMYPLAAGITAEYLNAYPLVNAKGIFEGQRGVDPNKRVFILTRSGFAGMQRYAAATWSGDISSRWHDMKLQISAGVNFSMSGLPYWTMDIGGFAVEKRFEKPDSTTLDEWREMNTRWYQFGAFVPLFRSHGQFPFREVYNIAPPGHPAYESMSYYNQLRYRLLPYTYSIAGKAYHDDYTMMRGLVMDFSNDSSVLSIDDQYMYGPSLLVNPITDYKARSRKLYLPSGEGWYDFTSGRYEQGGRHINAEAEYERMPVFVKAGSIIPIGPALQYTSEKKAETITLYVYGGQDATFTLYEDEGDNYNYEKGKFSTITFRLDDKAGKLTIEPRKGDFPGMLKKRTFRIVWVSPGRPRELNFDTKGDKTITYSGSQVIVNR